MTLPRQPSLLCVFVRAMLACLLCVAGLSAKAQDAQSIRLVAKPAIVLADGVSSTTITAEVRDGSGRLVADNEVVSFSTTLGTIETTGRTQGGQASVRLTSPTISGNAVVTASSGRATSETQVTFTNKVAGVDESTKSIVIRAKYLLYNDYEQVIDAAEDVHIRVGSVNITAERAQINLSTNTIIAEAQPGAAALLVSHGHDHFAVDKLHYNWDSRTGLASGLADPARGVFSFLGASLALTRAVGPVPAGTFTFFDLADSVLSVRASRIVILPGTEMQFTHAQILINGKKRLSLPYHVIPLGSARVGYAQYIGIGPRGPLLDLPYYVAAGASGTSQVRLKYNAPEGLYGATIAGWALDLVTKYSLGQSSDGEIELDRITSQDRGLFWTHNQQFDRRTHGYFQLDTRSAQGLDQRYTLANVSIIRQEKQFTATLTNFTSKATETTGATQLALQSTPHPLFSGFTWTMGTHVAQTRALSTISDPNNPGQTISSSVSSRSEGVDGRVSTPTIHFPGDGTVNASVGEGLSWTGGTVSHSVLGTVALTRPLGTRGAFSLNYNYNGYDLASQGYNAVGVERQTVTASLTYTRGPRWLTTAFATLGLDQKSRNYRIYSAYTFNKLWRATFNGGYLEQGYLTIDPILAAEQQIVFKRFNFEARLQRQLGERALAVVYSTDPSRIYLDYTPGTNF